MNSDFTFVVCAYKESPYLEEALRSARDQRYPVKIVVATSTPSAYVEKLAAQYGAKYCVNPEQRGIASDWNFALSCADTPYVTIAHQDDVYFPDYAQKVRDAMAKVPDSLIAFTNYGDLMKNGKVNSKRSYLIIKRLLLWAFYLKRHHRSRVMKRSAVAFGNAICCPSVTYHLPNLKKTRFDTRFSVNLDWAMWWKLTCQEGSFVFVPQILMAHRIADSMETAAAIADHRREDEDQKIFTEIWGEKTSSFLMKFYRKAYRSNQN